jgi:hypothetical protein
MKKPGKISPLEINGKMSTKSADQVGLLIAITAMLDKILWGITVVTIVVVMVCSDRSTLI